jgi:catechol 2,3-dioxygenase-like lactoylglutathione lyase family enzyme
MRRFDHIDLRVGDLASVREFYGVLLPRLGFTEDMNIPDWLQYSTQGEGPTEFFGVTQSPGHRPNENRIAFWASSVAEVDEIAHVLREIGARNIEGPSHEGSEAYYGVFFEDPPVTGSRSAIARRIRRLSRANACSGCVR